MAIEGKLKGYGKPSVLLPGLKGKIYIDQLTGDEYECKGERGFIRVDGDDQDNQFNWVLKKKEKPFYEEELITANWGGPFPIVRISSEVFNDFANHIPPNIPEGTTPEEITSILERAKPIQIWLADGSRDSINSPITSDGMVNWHCMVFCVYRDNFVMEGVHFPKRGTYVAFDTNYISGIGYIDDESPRITWDGQTTKLKKLDEKFIPSRIIGVINNDLTFTADPSFDPSTMSVSDALASGKDLLYITNSEGTTLKCIHWHAYDNGTVVMVGFHNPSSGEDIKLEWTTLDDGTVSIKAVAIPPITGEK